MNGLLRGKVALIAGSSGGIGSAVARLLAENGARLVLHSFKNSNSAAALRAGLSDHHCDCAHFKSDLSQPRACEKLVSDSLKKFGRLDILVNCSGAVIGQEDFLKLSPKDWDATLRLNVTSPFFLSREAFRTMRKSGGGRIIHISSVAAKYGGSARSMHYGAAKAALEAITVGMAREGAPHNILVNAIRAGVIDTPFHEKFKKDMAKRVAMIPVQCMGRPEDVARMALHLAGPGGDFITGQILPVTGGE